MPRRAALAHLEPDKTIVSMGLNIARNEPGAILVKELEDDTSVCLQLHKKNPVIVVGN
jgi:hypothetical protein